MINDFVVEARITGPPPGPWRPVAVEPQTTFRSVLHRYEIRPKRRMELRIRRLEPHETVEKLTRSIREFS